MIVSGKSGAKKDLSIWYFSIDKTEDLYYHKLEIKK